MGEHALELGSAASMAGDLYRSEEGRCQGVVAYKLEELLDSAVRESTSREMGDHIRGIWPMPGGAYIAERRHKRQIRMKQRGSNH